MKPVYISICSAIVSHPDQWTIIELRIEESIHNHARVYISPCTAQRH